MAGRENESMRMWPGAPTGIVVDAPSTAGLLSAHAAKELDLAGMVVGVAGDSQNQVEAFFFT